MTREPALPPAELAACRALIAGLDEAMGFEVATARAQQGLFQDMEPLGPAARVVLRAFVAAANRLDSEQPPLDGTALIAALEGQDHPEPGHSVFLCPARLAKVEDLVEGFGATGPFRDGVGARLALRLGRFAGQGRFALLLGKEGLHPFGVPEDWEEDLPPVPHHSRRALGRLRALLFHALVTPAAAVEQGAVRSLTALGCMRFTLDREAREARLEVRGTGGAWVASPAAWILDKPFHSLHWLDLFVEQQASRLVDPAGSPLGDDDIGAVRKRLHQEAVRSGLLAHYGDSIKRLLPLDPPLLAIARALSPPWGSRLTCNDHYNAVWQAPAAWAQAVRDSTELAPLLYALCRDGTTTIAEGLQGLKRVLLEAGIGGNGWKQLCAQGRHGYLLALQYSFTFGPPPEGHVARHVAFQGRLLVDAQGGLPEPLVRSIFTNTLVVRQLATLRLPARLLDIARAEYLRRPTAEARKRFLEDEWQPLLSWFAQAQPRIHANQWSGGWARLKRAAWDWTRRRLAEDGPPEWKPGVTTFIRLEYFAVPLVSQAQLEVDGILMAHCVAQYADACRIGGYKLFSARCVEGNRRAATIGIKLGEDGWEVDQVRRRCNQEGDEGLWRFAHKLAHHLDRENP